MIGFFCINKNVGDTSAFCVNKVKHLLKQKCGHMGTLDPLASGVLPIGIGQATRLFSVLSDKKKTYIADFDFSYSTPSFDLETAPDFYSARIPSVDEINSVLPRFIGNISQIPPAYSAKFVNGRRSYKLARSGKDVLLPPKSVEIYDIKLIKALSSASFCFEIVCGGGTYIRSIVRDLADALGVHGVMTSLTRVQSGIFSIDNSVTVADLISAESVEDYLIKPEDTLDLDSLILDKSTALKLLNGLYEKHDYADGEYKVFCEDDFWGIGQVTDGILKMKIYVRDI